MLSSRSPGRSLHLRLPAMDFLDSLTLLEESFERPQRPFDCPAGALPVETVIRIFELAVEDNPVDRQRMTYAFARVCYQWSTAVQKEPTAYSVDNWEQAQRLRMRLPASDQEQAVKTPAIRALRLAEGLEARKRLIRACPNLQNLHLHPELVIVSGLGAGSPQRGLLQCLSPQKLRELIIVGGYGMTAVDLDELSLAPFCTAEGTSLISSLLDGTGYFHRRAACDT